MQIASATVTVMLLVVLLSSAAGKSRSALTFSAFTRSLPAFGVPVRLARWVAVGVVAAELTAGVLLIVGPLAGAPAIGAWFSTALLAILTAGVLRAVMSGTDANCRCFGTRAVPLSWLHVGRNAVLLVCAFGASLIDLRIRSLSSTGVLIALGLGLVLGLIVTRLEDLVFLLSSSDPNR